MRPADPDRRAAAVAGAVERYVVGHGLLPAGSRVLLLLSGGPDSMALLALVRRCDRRLDLGLALSALHVDYGMRGAASDRDRLIVESACAAAGVPLEVLWPSPRLGPPDFQEKARSLRLDAARRAVEAGDVDLVATGHNLDDQAETIVYRLSKYASPTALTGMAPKAGFLVRPLLGVRAAALRDYCRVRGIEYGEDHTNQAEVYARNVVRHSILPQMERLNPGVVEALAAAADAAREQQTLLESLADQAWEEVTRDGAADLDVALLRGLPPAVQALVVRRLAAAALGPRALIERRLTDALLSLVRAPSGTRSVRLRGGWEALLERGRLSIREASSAAHRCTSRRCVVPPPGALPVAVSFCGRTLNVAQTAGARPLPPTAGALLGLPEPAGEIVLRHPAPGDTFGPLGLGAETSLGRFLSGQRVARSRHARVLVIEVGGVVAWVEVPVAVATGELRRPSERREQTEEGLHGRVAESFRVTESTGFTVSVREGG